MHQEDRRKVGAKWPRGKVENTENTESRDLVTYIVTEIRLGDHKLDEVAVWSK